MHPEARDAQAVEQSYRRVAHKRNTSDRPRRVVPSEGRFYYNNSDRRREYWYKTDDPPLFASESITIDDNDNDTIIDQLSAAFYLSSNLQTAIHNVWLVDVDEADIEALFGLTNIVSEYIYCMVCRTQPNQACTARKLFL